MNWEDKSKFLADKGVTGFIGPKGTGPCPIGLPSIYPGCSELERLYYLLYNLKKSRHENDESNKTLVDTDLLEQTIETLEFYRKLLTQSLDELLSNSHSN